MAAYKTPSPRTLSPEVPVVSYPTPNTSDLLVVLDVDTRLPSFQNQTYGDSHPDTANYPNHKLVYQMPLDSEGNHMWLRRVYAATRSSQDDYNYAIKFLSSDPDYPSYIRTYVAPRQGYAPLGKGKVDPLFPTSPSGNPVVLNSEEVERLKGDGDDAQLDSMFLKVTRVYTTLPGPVLTGQTINEFGSVVTTTQQRVEFGTPSEPGFGVVKDEVVPNDTASSTRTRVTVDQYPELVGTVYSVVSPMGGLGRHTSSTVKKTTKQRVNPKTLSKTDLDDLHSFKVIEASLSPVNIYESDLSVTSVTEFETLTSFNPSDPDANFAPTVTTETVVAAGSKPEITGDTDAVTIESKVEPVDSLRAIRTVKRLYTGTGLSFPIRRTVERFEPSLNSVVTEEVIMSHGDGSSSDAKPTTGYTVLSSEVKKLPNSKWLKTTVYAPATLPTQTSVKTDSWSGEVSNSTLTQVPPGTALPRWTPGRSYELEQRGNRAVLRSTVHAVPKTREEKRTFHFRTPKIFLGFIPYIRRTTDDWTLLPQYVEPNVVTLTARVEISYVTQPTNPQVSMAQRFVEASWNLPGTSGSGLTNQNLIMWPYGATPASVTVNGNTIVALGIGFKANLPQSYPSVAEWIAMIGTEQLVQYEVTPVEQIPGYYKEERWYVVVPGFNTASMPYLWQGGPLSAPAVS